MDNFIDTTRRYSDGLRHMVLTELHRLEKIFEQNLTRVDGRKVTFGHGLTSVVVNYLDVKGVPITPHKADAPLIVHTHAMLPMSVMGQRFKQMDSIMEAIARYCWSEA